MSFKSWVFGGEIKQIRTERGIRLSQNFALVPEFCRPLYEWGSFLVKPTSKDKYPRSHQTPSLFNLSQIYQVKERAHGIIFLILTQIPWLRQHHVDDYSRPARSLRQRHNLRTQHHLNSSSNK